MSKTSSFAMAACVLAAPGLRADDVITGRLDSIRLVDGTTFATLQAAINDIGTTLPGFVIIPPSYALCSSGACTPGPEATFVPPNVAILDLQGVNPSIGNASAVLRPKFDSNYNAQTGKNIGLMVIPRYGTLSNRNLFLTPLNVWQGGPEALEGPVPAGAKGQLGGYEANIRTEQRPKDLLPGEAGHGFGATITSSGGASYSVLNGIITSSGGTPTTLTRGLNVNVVNDSGVGPEYGAQYGIFLQSGGKYNYPITGGIRLSGTNFVDGIDLGGNSIVGVGSGTNGTPYALDVSGGFARFTYNTPSLPESDNLGGLAVGWNRFSGNADVDFYNLYDDALISYVFHQKTGAGAARELMVLLGNGNVGIGTMTPAYTLDVNGIIRGANLTPSDASLKTGVQPIAPTLEKIRGLRGVSFIWKADGRPDIGLIAQEVEKAFPDLVSTDANGLKSLNYAGVNAILLEAVKELARENETLRARVEDLSGIEARLDALEQQARRDQ